MLVELPHTIAWDQLWGGGKILYLVSKQNVCSTAGAGQTDFLGEISFQTDFYNFARSQNSSLKTNFYNTKKFELPVDIHYTSRSCT